MGSSAFRRLVGFRPTGLLALIMAEEHSSKPPHCIDAVETLGRSCKAKAKAWPTTREHPFLIGVYAAVCPPTLADAVESIARDAADAGGGTEPMAAAEPNP